MTISVYEPPLKGFGISLLKGELEVVSKTKLRPGSALEVDSLDLSKHILNRFSDQVSLTCGPDFITCLLVPTFGGRWLYQGGSSIGTYQLHTFQAHPYDSHCITSFHLLGKDCTD